MAYEHDTWMRTNIDFGWPMKRFRLNMRTEMGVKFWRMMGEMKACSKEAQALAISNFISTESRPELVGCQVVAMGSSISGMEWNFLVYHPLLPRFVEVSSEVPMERLEICPVCKKPLALDQAWLRAKGSSGVEVCSQECVTAPMPDEPAVKG